MFFLKTRKLNFAFSSITDALQIEFFDMIEIKWLWGFFFDPVMKSSLIWEEGGCWEFKLKSNQQQSEDIPEIQTRSSSDPRFQSERVNVRHKSSSIFPCWANIINIDQYRDTHAAFQNKCMYWFTKLTFMTRLARQFPGPDTNYYTVTQCEEPGSFSHPSSVLTWRGSLFRGLFLCVWPTDAISVKSNKTQPQRNRK